MRTYTEERALWMQTDQAEVVEKLIYTRDLLRALFIRVQALQQALKDDGRS